MSKEGNTNELLVSNKHQNADDTSCKDQTERMTWKHNLDFLLSLIGYGVGLGNIWRFPYLCAKNGGAVFLIPYAIFMLLLAFPLTFLELSLGQYSGKSSYDVWDICPAFRGLGVAVTCISAICALYYNVILAWVLYYFVHSFMSPLPWTTCDNWWNTEQCFVQKTYDNSSTEIYLNGTINNTLSNETIYDSMMSLYNITTNNTTTNNETTSNDTKFYTASEEFWNHNVLRISSGLEDMGGMQWHLVVTLAIGWVIIFLCLIKGVRSVGKVVYITATAPYIIITIILVRAVTLPGAIKGIEFYMIPDFHKLADIQIWIQAMMQLFFSMGMGWGVFITMSSYNKFSNNIMRDTIVYCIMGEGTSVYAGFVVFSILGFMSNITGLDVATLVRSGPGLTFITYPEALSQLPIPQLWAVLFFLMLLTVSLDTMFVNVEVVLTTIVDLLPNMTSRKRILVTLVTCFLMFLVTLIYTTKGGIYVFQLVDWYMATISLYAVTILECVVIGWIYGADRYLDDIEFMLGRRPSVFFKVLWRFVTPVFLLIVLLFTLIQYQPPSYNDYQYPPAAIAFGWVIALISAVPIPIWMVKAILDEQGSFLQRFKKSLQANCNWGPAKNYKLAVESEKDTEFELR